MGSQEPVSSPIPTTTLSGDHYVFKGAWKVFCTRVYFSQVSHVYVNTLGYVRTWFNITQIKKKICFLTWEAYGLR